MLAVAEQQTCRGEEEKQQQGALQDPLHDAGRPSQAGHGTLHKACRSLSASADCSGRFISSFGRSRSPATVTSEQLPAVPSFLRMAESTQYETLDSTAR